MKKNIKFICAPGYRHLLDIMVKKDITMHPKVTSFILAWALTGLLIAADAQAEYLVARANLENIKERRNVVVTEDVSPLTRKWGDASFTLSGLIEVEGSLVHIEGGEEDDDLRLNTVQIGLEAGLNSWLGGHISGLWEEDDTEPMVVDEAVISLTSPWPLANQTPALRLGRQYLSFGQFESGMISDPLTLELGETQTTAAVLALTGEYGNASLGVFDGSVDDGDDSLDSWVLAIAATPRAGVTLAASWISDLAESDAELVQDEGMYRDDVPGWSVFFTLQHGVFGLTAEYLAAVDRYKPHQVAAGEDLTGRRPQALNLELSWEIADKALLAARYEAADDYQADVRRYGATASYGLCNYALLAVEYLHADADASAPEQAFTAQLAVAF